MWDIIPDIHGQADKLEGLLKLLGYREVKEVWRHSDSERSAIFLGDFIDRVHIPGYPPTYSDNIRPFVPGYPPSFDALP